MQGQGWDALAERLLDRFGDAVAGRGTPEWLLVYPAGVTDDWSFQPAGPGAGTVGWTAPRDCAALGMVGSARVHAAHGPRSLPAGLQPGVTAGARLCCVVGRDRAVGWKMVIPGAQPPPEPPAEGRMLDCMLRALGLPTHPPQVSPRPLWSLLWLQAILAHGHLPGTSRLTWTQAMALHPLGPWIAGTIGPEHVEETILAGGVDMSWEKLRLATVADAGSSPLIPSGDAAWMDEGMFSRWVLAGMTPPEDLLDEARSILTGPAARKVGHALRSATAPYDRRAAS